MGSKCVLENATIRCVQDQVNRGDYIISRLHYCVDGLTNLYGHKIGIWDRRWDLRVQMAKRRLYC